MRRDILLLTEMIEAAEQAQALTNGLTVSDLEADRQRWDALLWNFTILGEAAGQFSDEIKTQFPQVAWQQPTRLRNRIVHGYWSIDMDVLYTTATTIPLNSSTTVAAESYELIATSSLSTSSHNGRCRRLWKARLCPGWSRSVYHTSPMA